MPSITHYLDPNAVNDGSRNAWQMLKDIWWALRTREGSILTAPITTYDGNGQASGETTPELEFAYMRENVAATRADIAALSAKIDALTAQQGNAPATAPAAA